MSKKTTSASAKVPVSYRERMQNAVDSSGRRWKTVSDFQREAIERLLEDVESTPRKLRETGQSNTIPGIDPSEDELPVDAENALIETDGPKAEEAKPETAPVDGETTLRARISNAQVSPSSRREEVLKRMLEAERKRPNLGRGRAEDDKGSR